ncbi:MAG: proton-conducting transporter membrane subunit [Gammaproteobacteria bacterium]
MGETDCGAGVLSDMNLDIYSITLWMAVIWPLLLAVPALCSRLPWPRHLALIPAMVLLILPGTASLELPWLLFGTGFAIDHNSRWILAMSITIWLMAATMEKTSNHNSSVNQANTFFMLTLAGNLGALLSTDLVGFFSFSALMGYGFYGLLIEGGNAQIRRAGRVYIIFLVLADLALFEALLLAAYSTENLHYSSVRQAMPATGSSQFYFWMAFTGFALKAGIWPVQLWLSASYRSAAVSRTLLLAGVPVAMALLGALRWLGIGEPSLSMMGMPVQILGLVAMLYTALRLITHKSIRRIPERLCMFGTGLFIAALGTGLAHPPLWHQYSYLVYPFIALWGIVLAVLVIMLASFQDTHPEPDFTLQALKTLGISAERWINMSGQWANNKRVSLQRFSLSLMLKMVKQCQTILDWPKLNHLVNGWSARITLLVLLGLAMAWLA